MSSVLPTGQESATMNDVWKFRETRKTVRSLQKQYEHLKARCETRVAQWDKRGAPQDEYISKTQKYKGIQAALLAQKKEVRSSFAELTEKLTKKPKDVPKDNLIWNELEKIQVGIDVVLTRIDGRESTYDTAVDNVLTKNSKLEKVKNAFSSILWGSSTALPCKENLEYTDSSEDEAEMDFFSALFPSEEHKSSRSDVRLIADVSSSSSTSLSASSLTAEGSTTASSSSSLSEPPAVSSSCSSSTEAAVKATETTAVVPSPRSAALNASKRSLSSPSMADLSSSSLSNSSVASSSSSSITKGADKGTVAEEDGADLLAKRAQKLRIREPVDSKNRAQRTQSADTTNDAILNHDQPLSSTSGAARRRKKAAKELKQSSV